MTALKPRSLPPLVDGDVFGNLTVTVDDVLWSKKYSGHVVVLLQWWGDSDTVSLRPTDVRKHPESTKDNTSVTYDIRTNLSLFETYLKQCSKLKLLLINNDTKEIVGHVVINDLHDLITGIQYHQYFPVITSCGVRIGDLRVHFDLSMNSVPEATTKKMKKRSRKKNKTSIQMTDEDDKSKQIKKGCKTCSEHTKPQIKPNPSVIELQKAIECYQVPPNTRRSDKSDNALLDVLEKGKKLRDAMVLSVMEDSDPNLDNELLLKLDKVEDFIPACKELLDPIKGDLVSNEEKLICDYLDGKAMKEEDEVFVLNTLHAEAEIEIQNSKSNRPLEEAKIQLPVQDGCCLSQASCPHVSVRSTSHPTDSNLTSVTFPDIENGSLQRVNCFRVTVESLTLTSAGWKKINNAIENRYKCSTGEAMQPSGPGATYFVECHFADDSPRCQAQPWKTTPLRFCSRRQIENVVYFSQSSAQVLRPPDAAARAETAISSGRGVVCWRHMARPLALLGQFTLAGVLRRGGVEATVTLPVTPEGLAGTPTAHLRLTVQLGRDKLYFGPALFENPQSLQKEKKTSVKVKEKLSKTDSAVHSLNVEDLRLEKKSKPNKRINQNNSSNRDKKTLPKCKTVEHNSVPDLVDLTMSTCDNCGQNLTMANCQNPADSERCVSCSKLLGPHKNYVGPTFDISIPPDLAIREQRHHEFLLGIDTVIGFPLFSALQEELSCYVDYKFPEVTSNLKVELGRTETTSRVVGCEQQPALSSVARHGLVLPVAQPLSPLLAASSPGVTLRLWLRYYKPTPRDHMVAMALLPMDKLCLMELEFDRKQPKSESAVVKVLELPLALVPSSVTAPYHHYQGLGTLRVTVTYSNSVRGPTPRTIHSLPSTGPRPIEELLSRLTDPTEDDLRHARNRFWTGPFGKQHYASGRTCQENVEEKIDSVRSEHVPKSTARSEGDIVAMDPSNDKDISEISNNILEETSRPVMKQDFDIFAESLEQKFNKLQSELLKERQRGMTVADSIALNTQKPNSINSDLSLLSLSSNSSMDSLPFILGPPANFKDVQNTLIFSKDKKPYSNSQCDQSESDTISGFLKEEKSVDNFGPNKPNNEDEKPDANKPETFKAKIKIDRAVNLKAVKMPSNGKKGKVPPSTWVAFGTGECCEHSCGSVGLVCSAQQFTTPIIRRSYNPIWNLAWDIDLPLDYLKQVNKLLVFRIFEENLDGVCFGVASANLSILTSGLPSLSSWLGINDLAGACKGQIKIVITPLEDLSKYQETSVFDADEDEFEELKETTPEPQHYSSVAPQSGKTSASFVASQNEVFLNDQEEAMDKKVEQSLKCLDNHEDDIDEDDPFSADDVISNYKSTLENNFRNEMAGLENLIKFLRVGSMTNGLSFMSSNENKENLSSNPVPTVAQPLNTETRSPPLPTAPEVSGKCPSGRGSQVANKSLSINDPNERRLIDVSTETSPRETPSSSNPNSEDIISRLLHQIVSVQPPAIKIADNASQTIPPVTKETFTETNVAECKPLSKTVHMRDASTETDDICDSRPPQPHVCGELGSALLQHFLACRPAPMRVSDSSCQTVDPESSGLPLRSGEGPRDSLPESDTRTNCDRLTSIDNNIKDLERFLKENLMLVERDTIPPIDSNEGSFCGSFNRAMDSIHVSARENSISPSDVESFEKYSQSQGLPRETPDGGNPATLNLNSDMTDNLQTSLKRRATFVINKSNEKGAESSTNVEVVDPNQQ